MSARSRLLWFALLAIVTAGFFWQITLSRRYSLLPSYEFTSVAYAWNNFVAHSVKAGEWPLWDRFSHSGRSYPGEMQTALFYPLKALLHLAPFGRDGLLSPHTFHLHFLMAHLLAAWFMFLLAGELGLGTVPAFLAAVTFSFGGFMGRVAWQHMLDSAVWLPLIALFLLRASRAGLNLRGALQAALAGLFLAMALLAGSIQIVIADVLAIVAAGAFWAVQRASGWSRAAAAIAVVAAASLALSAVQLLPSVEYSALANRYIGSAGKVAASEPIPYADVDEGFRPRAIMAFAIGSPFPGETLGGESFSPYLGVFPLLLAIIGVWHNWRQPWVRFAAGLAVLAFYYSLGGFSFLHGLLYAVLPYIWMSRDPGRFIYLTHFALAVLAAYGAHSLFTSTDPRASYGGMARVVTAATVVFGAGLGLAASEHGPVYPWLRISLYLLAATCTLFWIAIRVSRGVLVQAALAALLLLDLNVFNWAFYDVALADATGTNAYAQLMSTRGAAEFLKAQPGIFRVHADTDPEPNLTVFGLETTGGMSATIVSRYDRLFEHLPTGLDLVNVRYLLRSKPLAGQTPVWHDAKWFVYERPQALPRAWLVHQMVAEPDEERAVALAAAPGFDARRTAVVPAPLPLDAAGAGGDDVTVPQRRNGFVSLKASASSRALLVLSEVAYPGWNATVNGEPAAIHLVDGVLRGVVVPGGSSTVEFRYRPRSIIIGAAISLGAVLALLLLAGGAALQAKHK